MKFMNVQTVNAKCGL